MPEASAICSLNYEEGEMLMASEMLRAVLDAEKQCAADEADAKKQAELDKQNARQQAKDMVAKAQKDAEQLLKDNEAAMSARTEKEVGKARAEAQVECLKLSKNAQTNLDRVTKLVVEMLAAQ